MKYRAAIIEQLNAQAFFEKRAVRQLGEQFGLKSTTIDAYISQSIRRKEILPLRRGLYVATDFYDAHKGEVSYSFYLANVLRRPSYVSSWAALQYYNLTTEVIRTTTCVTAKVTRDYRTKVGTFSYQSIQKRLFAGFTLERGTFDFYIATPAKALFDLLYFRTRQFRGITLGAIDHYVQELRIDLDEMDDRERQTFYTLVQHALPHE
jgi:predicted transcriptional regulator of viral defense system